MGKIDGENYRDNSDALPSDLMNEPDRVIMKIFKHPVFLRRISIYF